MIPRVRLPRFRFEPGPLQRYVCMYSYIHPDPRPRPPRTVSSLLLLFTAMYVFRPAVVLRRRYPFLPGSDVSVWFLADSGLRMYCIVHVPGPISRICPTGESLATKASGFAMCRRVRRVSGFREGNRRNPGWPALPFLRRCRSPTRSYSSQARTKAIPRTVHQQVRRRT